MNNLCDLITMLHTDDDVRGVGDGEVVEKRKAEVSVAVVW